MKKIELENAKLVELSQNEMTVIDAGRSIWYEVGYTFGIIAAGVEAFCMGASDGGYAANKAN